MIKISIKLLRRNILPNIFVSMQIAITLMLAVVCISSIYSKVEDYLPLRKVLSSQGQCISTTGNIITPPYDQFNLNEIKKENKNIQEVYGCEKYDLFSSKELGESSVYSYTDNLFDLYTPQLFCGEWAKQEKGVICATCTYNDKYKLNDIITVYDADYNEYQLKITGILKEGAKIINTSVLTDTEINFKNLYETPKGVRFFVNRDDMQINNITATPSGCIFVEYKDDINENEKTQLHQQLYKYGSLYGLADEININSIEYIRSDIVLILPITICILILSIISSISVSAINTKKNLRTYAVLSICGANWKNTIFSCLFCNLIINLTGLSFAAILLFAAKHYSLFGNIILNFNVYEIFVCVIILAFNILLSVLFPEIILKIHSPKNILSANQ